MTAPGTREPGLRVGYVCKAVDEGNPSLATQARWVRALSERSGVAKVHVLTPYRGRVDLPPNVKLHVFGREAWPKRAVSFLRLARRVRSDVDFYFVAQGGPYPALLAPLRLLGRRPVYQWKAHAHVSRRMAFYARFCDDLVFTATPGSFPLSSPKVRVVGHGIDTDLFQPDPSRHPTRDVIVIGRVAPIKNLDLVIAALHECRVRYGTNYSLDIVGPCARKDQAYRAQLDAQVESLGLEGDVRFLGPIDQRELPALLADHRVAVNVSETAFDKAAGEAMASGVPVVTTNPCMAEVLPADIRDRFTAPADDVAAVATRLHETLALSDAARHELGLRLREAITSGHGLSTLFGKVLDEISLHRAGAASGDRIAS